MGCNEAIAPPDPDGALPEGTLVVITATAGSDADPDGYSLTLDAVAAGPVGANARTTLSELTAGRHEVALGGLAGNCRVSGDNPRTVTVTAADTVEARFAVSCAPLSATVIVTTSTSGAISDPDGYLLSVDGAEGRAMGSRGSLTITGLEPGPHRFELLDLASNCTVSGDNPIMSSLEPGSTVSVTFSVACAGVVAANLLFTGAEGNVTHVFERRTDGSIVDLTPSADGGEASWSPDGSRIVFTSVRSGTLGIYVMDADGRHVVRLTNNGETSPSWSPDGTKILFWPYATAGFGQITVMNADGTGVRVLGNGSRPAWSPDGSRIAFERAELDACVFDLCALNLYTMTADGTDIRRLTANTMPFEYAAAPAWSPDGVSIAFLSGGLMGGPILQVMTSTGASRRSLGSVASAPVWSPAGEAIAVARGTPSRVVAIPVAGGTAVELLDRPGAFPTAWR
jgi:hypothetical protein